MHSPNPVAKPNLRPRSRARSQRRGAATAAGCGGAGKTTFVNMITGL
jgi:ABC-type molybdate transport system ATPase subunit